MTGTVACSSRAALRPSPPRGITRSTSPSWVAIWRSSSRSPPATIEIAPSGSPTEATASCATWASAMFEWAAVEEPRSTIALPDFRHSGEQSIVTLGPPSSTPATTPSGPRPRRRSSPFGRRWPSIVSPTGSGRAAISSTEAAIPRRRSSSSFRRSRRAAPMPACSPASMSRALASRISGTRRPSAAAMASSAAFLVAPSSVASTREAALACAHTSATLAVAVAISESVLGRLLARIGLPVPGCRGSASGLQPLATSNLLQHEVVAMDGFLGRPRHEAPDLLALQPLDPAQLVRRVVHDPLADRTAVGAGRSNLDRVAGLEAALDLDHADRQQAGPALAERPLCPGVHEQPAVAPLRVLEPQLEARYPPALGVEPSPARLAPERPTHRPGIGPPRDHRGYPRRGCHLGGHHLGAHPA